MPHTPVHIELSNAGPAQRRPSLSPQERALRDAAQMSGRKVHWLEGVAVIPAFVTFAFLLYMIARVAQGPEQVLVGSLLAAFITALIALLPVTAFRMKAVYPQAHKHAMGVWAAFVFIGIISALVYFTSSRAGETEGLVLLAICAASVPLTGILPLWATMSAGEVVGSPAVAAAQPMPAVETMGYSDGDVFGMWACGCLAQDQQGKVSSTAALASYREACDLNGVPPMTDAKFFGELKRLAMQTNGAVYSSKSGGNMFYNGWSLSRQLREIESAPLERIQGPR